MHTQKLPAPIVLIAPSGEDSLLVYTYENILYHYVISVSDASVKLVQVGQIALHGIIRAPTRVRALSWILPEDQIRTFLEFQYSTIAKTLQITVIHHKTCPSQRFCFLWTANLCFCSRQLQRVANSSTRCASSRRTWRRMLLCEITQRSHWTDMSILCQLVPRWNCPWKVCMATI
jgi:hypothetical protein